MCGVILCMNAHKRNVCDSKFAAATSGLAEGMLLSSADPHQSIASALDARYCASNYDPDPPSKSESHLPSARVFLRVEAFLFVDILLEDCSRF